MNIAYIYAIAGIAVSVVMAVLSLLNIKSEIISDAGHVIESFIDTVVALYVISGIRNIANKIGQTDMDTRGKKVFAVYAASIILASIVELAAAFMQGGPRIAVVAVLGAIVIVLTIAGYFMYLSYLSKAKKMLA